MSGAKHTPGVALEALKAVAAQGDAIAELLTNGKHDSRTEAAHQRWKRMQKTWDALMGQVADALAASQPESGVKP